MSKNNFRFGVSSFGMPILGGGMIPATTGKYWFVSSDTGSDGNSGKAPTRALATLDAAIGKCTADKGDVIIIMPGHTETLASAGAVTCDIAGVYVIGLGTGTLRPAFSLSATDSSILVTAANVSIVNCTFSSGVAELVTCFTVSAAGFTLEGCAVTPTATSMINFMTTTAAADKLTIKHCDFVTTAIPTADDYFIMLVGGDIVKIKDNYFSVLTSNNAGSGSIGGETTVCTAVEITDNTIYSVGTSVVAIRLYTGSTGIISGTRTGTTKTDASGVIVSDATFPFDNLATNNLGGSGFVDPAIDTAG